MRDVKIKNVSKNKVSGNTFTGNKEVVIGQKIEQKIIDKSSTYNIDHQDVQFLESASIKIINKYGEKKPTVAGAISLIAGLITILGSFNSFTQDKWISWLPQFSSNAGIWLIVIGVCLVAFGGFCLNLVRYKYDSRCPECKEFWAMKETGEPTERETLVKGGIRVTTTRHYKCKHCGFKDSEKDNRFISNEELRESND